MYHSTAPFDVRLVLEQLKPLMPDTLNHLGSTAEYRSIPELSMAGLPTPAAYVVPHAEVGQQSDIAIRQMVTATFGVIVIVQSYQYSPDNPQLNAAGIVIGKIRERLMGWRPPLPGAKDTFFVRGDVLTYTNTYLAWMETYQTKIIIGKNR